MYSRFRRWAARRARQFSIAVLILTGIVVVGACGVMLRRATCLIGLPDVGDPFDVAALRTFRVPEDQDAFALFRQAAGKLRPVPDLPMAVRQGGGLIVAWSQANPQASRVARGKSRSPGSLSAGRSSTGWDGGLTRQ